MKTAFFMLVLLCAAAVDYKTQLVPTRIHIAMLFTGLLNVGLSSLSGFAVAFLPFFLAAMLAPEEIGGGDVKLAGMIGFCMGGLNGIFALMLALILAISVISILQKLLKRKLTPFPLVPFYAVGCGIFIFFLGGI